MGRRKAEKTYTMTAGGGTSKDALLSLYCAIAALFIAVWDLTGCIF